jgi:hypothetical protein
VGEKIRRKQWSFGHKTPQARTTLKLLPPKKSKKKPMSHTKIVTGCLQKGDEPGEFSITGKDVRTRGVRSDSVKLEQHVGHQVTVTASAHRESKAQVKAEEKKEGQMENAAVKEEHGHLTISSIEL